MGIKNRRLDQDGPDLGPEEGDQDPKCPPDLGQDLEGPNQGSPADPEVSPGLGQDLNDPDQEGPDLDLEGPDLDQEDPDLESPKLYQEGLDPDLLPEAKGTSLKGHILNRNQTLD